MKEALQHAIDMIHSQEKNRREWRAQTPLTTATLLHDESKELVHSITHFDAIQDAELNVVSEIGDVLILGYRLAGKLGATYMEKDTILQIRETDPLKLAQGVEVYSKNIVHILPTSIPLAQWHLENALSGTVKLCHVLGIEPAQAMEYKGIRNAQKYQDWMMSNGWDEQTARKMSKDLYTSMGGEHKFNQWYEQSFPVNSEL